MVKKTDGNSNNRHTEILRLINENPEELLPVFTEAGARGVEELLARLNNKTGPKSGR